jgi:hypothetical protein
MQIDYTNKPSITTLRAAIKKAAAAENTFIVLTWGENQITLEKTAYGWHGRGWIGRNGGQDLADELETQETGRDRFGVNVHNSFNTPPKKAAA